MAWPLNRVCCRLGLVPRRLTRSFSPKPPSPPADDCVFTPGRRWIASATFLSGILPMSSAVTTSTTASALRFWRSDCSSAARTPVTTTDCACSPGAASCAPADAAAPIINTLTAVAIAVRLMCWRAARDATQYCRPVFDLFMTPPKLCDGRRRPRTCAVPVNSECSATPATCRREACCHGSVLATLIVHSSLDSAGARAPLQYMGSIVLPVRGPCLSNLAKR